MKYLRLVGGLAALCGAIAAAPAAASPQIAAKAGCTTCHAADKKMVGPSFHDIAAKYKGNAEAPALLAERTRKGGKGVWGQVAMPPSDAAKISDADLKAVIAWILKTP
jgi:cytochrome c